MSKTKLAAAHELIREKNYAAARAILLTIPTDETARTWLRQIDFITAPRRRSHLPLVILIALIVTLLAAYAVLRTNSSAAAERLRAHLRLPEYCVDVYWDTVTDPDALVGGCFRWLDIVGASYDDEALACHRRSPDLDAPFFACLAAEDVQPIVIPPEP